MSNRLEGKTIFLTAGAQGVGRASALAFAAEILNQNPSIKDPSFADLRLDDKGNVVFSMKATVDPDLLSYEKMVEKVAPTIRPTSLQAATSTPLGSGATTTPRSGSSTSPRSGRSATSTNKSQ